MASATTMKALVMEDKGSAAVQQVSVPKAKAGEVLLKVKGVALNPTDWKHRDWLCQKGDKLGCDVAGEVVELGEGVTSVKVGDRLAGWVHGGDNAEVGAFAEYVAADAETLWKVPESLSWEEAAAMGGIGPDTAWFALQYTLGLASPSSPTDTFEPILIWGGATSVGLYAIQLAKMSGYTVIATSSPKNFELLKSFGADDVYAYADSETPSKISAKYPKLSYALDTISEKGTGALCSKSLGTEGGKKRLIKLLAPEEGDAAGLDVEVQMILAYTLLGKAFHKFGRDWPAQPELKEALKGFRAEFPSFLGKGLKSNPLWKQEGGLEGVNDGLNLLKEGKNSGQKVTFAF